MTEEEIQVIKKSFLFRKLEERKVLRAVKDLDGYVKKWTKGQILFQEGDQVSRIGIVLGGEARVCRLDAEGAEKLYQKLHPGYMLAADIACTPSRISPYTVYSSGNTAVWYFSYERLKTPGFMEEEARAVVKERLLEFIANENIRKFYQVDMLSVSGAKEKILKYLEIQCRKAKSPKVEIPYNREELANYLCMNRSVLSHTLSGMRKEGILEFKKNWFYLKKNGKRE